MINIGLILEYEDILLGKKRDFSVSYIGKENAESNALAVIRYAFEELLGWSPTTIRDFVSLELIKKLHLQRAVNKIEFPPELDPKEDLFYLAWLLYPHTVHHTRRDLTLHIYQRVLNGDLIKFPKNFFLTANGELNASICLQYAINQKLYITSIHELYAFFSDFEKAKEFLKEVRLITPCNDIYDAPIDMLHFCLPKIQRNDLYYYYYRFQNSIKETKENIINESHN